MICQFCLKKERTEDSTITITHSLYIPIKTKSHKNIFEIQL